MQIKKIKNKLPETPYWKQEHSTLIYDWVRKTKVDMTLQKLVETSKYHLSCMYYSSNECYGDDQPVNYRVQFTLCVEEIMFGTVAHDDFGALIIMWIVAYKNGWIHMLILLYRPLMRFITIRSACASSHPFTNCEMSEVKVKTHLLFKCSHWPSQLSSFLHLKWCLVLSI